jgi:hypothetical protein
MQSPEWKELYCTPESPDYLRGSVIPVYFSETGQVSLFRKHYPATVTGDQIYFCYHPLDDVQACYDISRNTGEFSFSNPSGKVTGTCYAEAEGPEY